MQPRSIGHSSGDGPCAVAIYRAPLFNSSETFVRGHPLALKRYRTLLAGLEDKGNIPPELLQATFLPRNSWERMRGRFGTLDWLAARLETHGPKLVHAHFGPDGLSALDLAQHLNVPLVTTLHGYDVSRTRRALLLSGRLSWARYALGRRRLMRDGDLFLAVSGAVRRMAIQRGFPADRTITHYLGVDLAAFVPGDADDGETILHVGRLVEKKGTSVLIEAFARMRAARPQARLVIIGDGPRRRSLERLAAKVGVGEAVRFLGSRQQAVVAEWMRRAALLAVPSVTAGDGDAEGLPTVVMEAAASGLPVIGSDHSGIPEAIDHGRTGFIVAEGQSEPLAHRLGELLASRELRRSMGRAGRSLAEARFDRVKQFARMEELYDCLIAGRAVSA